MNSPTIPLGACALVVGAGSGLSAALARRLTGQGMKVALAARRPENLQALCEETGAVAFECDAADAGQVAQLFEAVELALGAPEVVVYNASARARGALIDLEPDAVARTLAVSAFGGFLVAQQAARSMLARSRGAILFTGASASLKGYAGSAPFAMGKFALRGLAQSLARELGPQGIHVAHVVIDGVIRPAGAADVSGSADAMLDPDAIAANYLHLLQQPRSAWTWEIELRPWVERF